MNITGHWVTRVGYNENVSSENNVLVWPDQDLFRQSFSPGTSGTTMVVNVTPKPSTMDANKILQQITFDASKKWTGEKTIL